MPKEAWFYTLSYELMKGTTGEIWSTNQKLMRRSPGVGSHFKKGMKRKKHKKIISLPIEVAFLWL